MNVVGVEHHGTGWRKSTEKAFSLDQQQMLKVSAIQPQQMERLLRAERWLDPSQAVGVPWETAWANRNVPLSGLGSGY
jgi:hypothetical protein